MKNIYRNKYDMKSSKMLMVWLSVVSKFSKMNMYSFYCHKEIKRIYIFFPEILIIFIWSEEFELLFKTCSCHTQVFTLFLWGFFSNLFALLFIYLSVSIYLSTEEAILLRGEGKCISFLLLGTKFHKLSSFKKTPIYFHQSGGWTWIRWFLSSSSH